MLTVIGGLLVLIASTLTLIKVCRGSRSKFAISILAFSEIYGIALMFEFYTIGRYGKPFEF